MSSGVRASATAAAKWVVRIASPSASEADILAFDAWLLADPNHAASYDDAVKLWCEVGVSATAINTALPRGGRRTIAILRPHPQLRRQFAFGLGAAAAAAVAVAVLPLMDTPAAQTYATVAGEHRKVRLGDGTVVELNGATSITATMGRQARRVVLARGEAVFTVAYDARSRPFTVAAGDRTIRDVGTTFNVRRLDGQLTTTVAEGMIDVEPAGERLGKTYRLHPGQRLTHFENDPRDTRAEITIVNLDEVASWRGGLRAYRNAPLREVVADLNQQFAIPIRIEGEDLAEARISTLLVLDSQQAVIRRIALLVPMRAVSLPSGVVLRRDGAALR